MSPKEASRLVEARANPREPNKAAEDQPAVRREEESAARPLVREATAEASARADAQASGANPSGEAPLQSLDDLERAAENIRPSWHGAEIDAPATQVPSGLPALGGVPAALPPPPALPSFSSFPIEQRAPFYSADSTVRTAAVLPERLAELLSQPQIAHASHWLRGRPWAIAGLAVSAVILLALLIWPSSPDQSQQVAQQAPANAERRAPPPPIAPPAPAMELAPPPAAEPAAETSPNEPAAPATGGKKKRAARVVSKPIAPKARKPAKAVGIPAR